MTKPSIAPPESHARGKLPAAAPHPIPTSPRTDRPLDVTYFEPWRHRQGPWKPGKDGTPMVYETLAAFADDLGLELDSRRVSTDQAEARAAADKAERTLEAECTASGTPPTDDERSRVRRAAEIDAVKGGLLAFSPASFTGDRRSKETCERVTLYAGDHDAETEHTWAEAVARLNAAGVAWLSYGSPKDGLPKGDDPAKCVRRRLLVALSRDVLPDESGRVRAAVAQALGLTPDASTVGDESRLFYVGSVDDATPYTDGALDAPNVVDVGALLAKEAPEPSTRTRSPYGGISAEPAPCPCPAGVEPIEHARTLARTMPAAVQGRHGHTMLFNAACALVVGLEIPPDDARALLWGEYNPRCRPPWTDDERDEFDRKIDEAETSSTRDRGYLLATQTPSDDDDQHAADPHAPDFDPRHARDEKRSDLGNAKRLIRKHGARLRHCSARDAWYVWDGARWAEDETGEVMRCAKDSAASLCDAIHLVPMDRREALVKWSVQSQNAGRLDAAIKLAKTEAGVAVRVTELDADPWLLNVRNGTLDLRTGDLRAPDPALLMTKCCAAEYDPGACSELWDAFVARTFGGDAELIAYVQRAFGYALLGAWREKAFWFGYGPPDGAKSTFIGTIGHVLGSYHVSVDPETWMVRHNVGGNRGDLVRLLGARLATSLEIRPGLRFDAALMKKVTGGDPIVAAAKYEGEIEFPPTFALWMGANDRPIIPDDDDGFWNRVRCVPFTHCVPPSEQDRALRERLTSAEHAPAVLAWLVAGCLAWQRDGIGACAAVTNATRAYRDNMNRAAGFFEERCKLTNDPTHEVSCRAMRAAYEAWCEQNGVRIPLAPKPFGQRLRALGVGGGDDASRHAVYRPKAPAKFGDRERSDNDRHWTGVQLTDG